MKNVLKEFLIQKITKVLKEMNQPDVKPPKTTPKTPPKRKNPLTPGKPLPKTTPKFRFKESKEKDIVNKITQRYLKNK
jgi:hypothetical protein